MEEDINKTNFETKWGSFSYKIMPFILKNAHVVFSRIVIATFREFLHNFLEVYLDDWTIYNLQKRSCCVPLINARSLLTNGDLFELTKMHFLCFFWQPIEKHCMPR